MEEIIAGLSVTLGMVIIITFISTICVIISYLNFVLREIKNEIKLQNKKSPPTDDDLDK